MRRMVKRGDSPEYSRVGGQYRFSRESIVSYLIETSKGPCPDLAVVDESVPKRYPERHASAS